MPILIESKKQEARSKKQETKSKTPMTHESPPMFSGAQSSGLCVFIWVLGYFFCVSRPMVILGGRGPRAILGPACVT